MSVTGILSNDLNVSIDRVYFRKKNNIQKPRATNKGLFTAPDWAGTPNTSWCVSMLFILNGTPVHLQSTPMRLKCILGKKTQA